MIHTLANDSDSHLLSSYSISLLLLLYFEKHMHFLPLSKGIMSWIPQLLKFHIISKQKFPLLFHCCPWPEVNFIYRPCRININASCDYNSFRANFILIKKVSPLWSHLLYDNTLYITTWNSPRHLCLVSQHNISSSSTTSSSSLLVPSPSKCDDELYNDFFCKWSKKHYYYYWRKNLIPE